MSQEGVGRLIPVTGPGSRQMTEETSRRCKVDDFKKSWEKNFCGLVVCGGASKADVLKWTLSGGKAQVGLWNSILLTHEVRYSPLYKKKRKKGKYLRSFGWVLGNTWKTTTQRKSRRRAVRAHILSVVEIPRCSVARTLLAALTGWLSPGSPGPLRNRCRHRPAPPRCGMRELPIYGSGVGGATAIDPEPVLPEWMENWGGDLTADV